MNGRIVPGTDDRRMRPAEIDSVWTVGSLVEACFISLSSQKSRTPMKPHMCLWSMQ